VYNYAARRSDVPPTLRRPRYDLAAARRSRIEIGTSCARRACATLGGSEAAARRHIDKLFKSLSSNDFAHVASMHPNAGPAIHADVYGKRDEHAVWFIKFTYDGKTTTVIMSCHEAEQPIELADGRTLRKRA
jgi:hypothetical protein